MLPQALAPICMLAVTAVSAEADSGAARVGVIVTLTCHEELLRTYGECLLLFVK